MALRIEIEDGRLGTIVIYCEEAGHRDRNLSDKVKEEIELAMIGERPADVEDMLGNLGINVILIRIVSHDGEIRDINPKKK